MNSFVRYSAGLALLLSAEAALQAQQIENRTQDAATTDVDELVVTGTRSERPASTVPYVLHVLDDETLVNRRQARSVPEALGEVAGIMVQKTGHGQGSPYMRGFTGFRTLFLIDGIRLNNSTFRDGPNQYWNTVDPLSLSRLEIVKGPSSVLYGSDAVGGTVNALLLSPLATPESDGFSARTLYRYADAENASVARVQLGYKSDAFSILAGLSYKDFGDLDSGAGVLPRTGYREDDADVRIEYAFNENETLIFARQQMDQDDAWRTHQTVYAVPFRGSRVGSELARILYQDRSLTYVQYRLTQGEGIVNAVRASVSLQEQGEQRYRERSGGRIDRQGFDVETAGLSLQLETLADAGQWVYGLEAYLDTVTSFRRTYDGNGTLLGTGIQGPVADDAKYDLLGVFAERQLPIGNRWELIPGIRYTRAEAVANKVEHPLSGEVTRIADSWNDTVASLRLRYELGSGGMQLFGGISQGFRAPNLSDLTRLDTARTNEIETPVPSLDPEHFVSYEVGFKRVSGAGKMQVALYHTDIDDLIVRTPTGGLIDGSFEVTKRNSGTGFIRGLDFDGAWSIRSRLTLFAGFAWLDGEIDTFPTSAPEFVREPIDRLMPVTTSLGIRWHGPSERYWFEVSTVRAEDQDELSTRDMGDTSRIPPGGTPGYTVLNLRSTWRISPMLSLSAAVANVTDQNYRIHGSGLNEPGRNLMMSLDGRFR